MVKTVGIVQARLSSTRLPGKVMKDLCGKTLIQRVIERIQLSGELDEIWIATSDRAEDDLLEYQARSMGVYCFRGSLDNVLERYHQTAEEAEADIVVRVTADNPLTEPRFIDQGVKLLTKSDLDYVRFESIPVGSGSEIITKRALSIAYKEAILPYDQEHVTPYIIQNSSFKMKKIKPNDRLFQRPDISVTVDTLEQYVQMYRLFNRIGPENVTLERAIEYLSMEK